MSDNLEDFLHKQSNSGDHDSEGVFTLSVQKASWKLSQFQLSDRDQFPVHLAACAVASGATLFRIHHQHRALRLFFNGPPFLQKDLEALSLPLMGAGIPRHIREFGIAFNSVARHYRTEFFSFTKTSGIRLTYSNKEVHIEELESKGFEGQVLLVEGYEFKPDAFLKQCKFAPLDLSVNGVRQRESFEFGMFQDQLVAHYHRQGGAELMIRPPTLASYEVRRFHMKDKSRRSLALALTVPSFAQKHGWVLIADGVKFAEPYLIDSPIICGVVDCSDLEKDISQSGFLKNESFEAMRTEVQATVDHFLESLCAEPISMTEELTNRLRAELLKRFPDPRTHPMVRAFLKPVESDVHDQSHLNALAKRAVSSGDSEVLEKMRQDLRSQAKSEYLVGSLSKALVWLGKEQRMLASADLDTTEVEDFISSLRFTHEEVGFDKSLDGDPTYQGELKQVILHGEANLSAVPHIPEGFIHLMRTARLISKDDELVESLTRLTPEWQMGMKIWSACKRYEFSLAMSHMGTRPVTSKSYSAWSDMIWLTFKGKMSWKEEIQWRVRRAFDFGQSQRDVRRQADFKKIRDGKSSLGELLLKPSYEDVEVQLAVAHLLALPPDGFEQECLKVIGRTLLRQHLLKA